MLSQTRLPSLDAWLVAATRGLCDDARERIGEEIASHYEDALSEARADGLAEDVVIARAVRLLGSPRRARRRLRREHLSRREAKALRAFVTADITYMRTHGGKRFDHFAGTFLSMGFAVFFAALWLLQMFSDGVNDPGSAVMVILSILLTALFLGFLFGQILLLRLFGVRIGRKLYPDGRLPVWRVVQLQAVQTVTALAHCGFIVGNTYSSEHEIFFGRLETWSVFHWVLAASFMGILFLTPFS